MNKPHITDNKYTEKVERTWIGPEDAWCEKGIQGCLSTVCPCTNTFPYRWANARARGLTVREAIIYSMKSR